MAQADKATAERQREAEESRRNQLIQQADTVLQVEEKRAKGLEAKIANDQKQATANAEAIRLELAPFKELNPAVLLGYALQKNGIGPVTITTDMLAALNGYAQGFGDIETSPDAIARHVEMLPAPTASQYYLLAINLDAQFAAFAPTRWIFLGCDLCDETETSSLLNCGPWLGRLKPFTERLNSVGLLSLNDARDAQRLLPQEWGHGTDHARVDVWALYTPKDP